MTPSLIRTEYLHCQLTSANRIEKDVQGNVTIALGSNFVLSCNRPEDFENLRDLAQKALDLINTK